MEKTPESRMTLRQALAGKWQIPLFLVSVVVFASLLFELRPGQDAKTFEQCRVHLVALGQRGQYQAFYSEAEQLRLASETDQELGQVHGLVAKFRAQELRERGQLGVDTHQPRSAESNYQAILEDYREAISREWEESPSGGTLSAYHDMGLSYWCLNDAEKAVAFLNKAILARSKVVFELNRDLTKMYLASQPEGYLEKTLILLDEVLGDAHFGQEARAWAAVRKADVMIAQGREKQALDLLNASSSEFKESKFSNEMEFMRGRALRHAGEADLADLILRDLLKRIEDRGDIYAQTLLELGKINYGQFRDHEAKRFYQNVVATQLGKSWYVGGVFGLAQCAAMQKRYEDSIDHYQKVVSLLKKRPFNRVVEVGQVQKSLSGLTRQLGLQKEYALSLRFMEIQNNIAQNGDIEVVDQFARMNEWRANQLLDQVNESQQQSPAQTSSETDQLWLQQQQRMILHHFERSAQGYLRVAKLSIDNDKVYGENLWRAATNYDKAGNTEKSIETWHRIVTEREGKFRWPLALYRLAQSYQAIGDYEPAIDYYVLLQQRHPKSPDVFKSMVALGKCFLSKSDPEREKAEALFKRVLTNRAVTPKAMIYRDALFELGKLYYDHQDYRQAIEVFSEAIDRYPQDETLGKSLYMMADAYRQNGLALDATLRQLTEDPTTAVNQEKTLRLRQQYIDQARSNFTQAIKFYSSRPEDRLSKVDETYLRYCWLYRAACFFDLGLYGQAAEAYEEAALRYQLTPMALGAFVQVMNCQLLQGNVMAAKSIRKRAVWQLRQMSDAAFGAGPMNFTRTQWDSWFQWLETAQLW